MFNKEKNISTSERQYTNSATLISNGTVVTGNIKSDNDLRIDGTLHGNVSGSAKIIVGPSGLIEGNIEGLQADICGKVIGNIIVKEFLQLRGQCDVQGNISATKLQVEPTAVFNGKCQMGSQASVVPMSEMDVPAKAK